MGNTRKTASVPSLVLFVNYAVILMVLCATASVHAASFFEEDGMVVIEAEHYDGLRGDTSSGVSWELGTDEPTATSNGAYMLCPDNTNNNFNNMDATTVAQSPRMDFVCDFTTGGTYYIWLLAKDKSGNSMHFGIDGQANSNADQIQWDDGWVWTTEQKTGGEPAFLDIPAGEHTVNIYQREELSALDKIVITKDINYVPTGFGPDETAGGLGNTPPEITVTPNRLLYWPDTDSIIMNPTITDDNPDGLGPDGDGEIGVHYGSILWSCSDPNVSFVDDSVANAVVNF